MVTLTSMEYRIESADVYEDRERSEKRFAPAKYPHAKEVFALWGKYPKNWLMLADSRQRQAAENLYEERGLEDIKEAIDFYNRNKTKPFCPTITSPYDLDSKWAKLEAFLDRK